MGMSEYFNNNMNCLHSRIHTFALFRLKKLCFEKKAITLCIDVNVCTYVRAKLYGCKERSSTPERGHQHGVRKRFVKC